MTAGPLRVIVQPDRAVLVPVRFLERREIKRWLTAVDVTEWWSDGSSRTRVMGWDERAAFLRTEGAQR